MSNTPDFRRLHQLTELLANINSVMDEVARNEKSPLIAMADISEMAASAALDAFSQVGTEWSESPTPTAPETSEKSELLGFDPKTDSVKMFREYGIDPYN